MARSRETILLPGLLLAVLLLAAAPGDADAAAVQGCQPEVLAPTVALFCARGQPAVWCCQALAHSARVGGGAGCLCRLAAEEPLVRAALNATNLLWLYAVCDDIFGDRDRAAAPSACEGGGAPAAVSPVDTSGCATAVLADQMELFCDGGRPSSPIPPCCEAVAGSARMGADGVPCFCHVPLLSSSFGLDRISGLYAACVGSGHGADPNLPVYMCPRPPDANGRA
ncbi:hypothetical protein PVAP13_4NG236700 [Panicum virgatum]|jgi:hypothetical protein|uniref:Bifunctional inhibitor/plant lipid transfer protein/seed storage helical domain-containing protein n=1 Tax=Panicum virgatum TaxID=38727 RepID=A0A8T0T6G0_PANVG|nr:hypothetical protein PVAP13_4NG236700 [Panicum virgatum]